MAKQGKRLAKVYDGINRENTYSVSEAVSLVKKGATAKFDETI